MLKAILAVVVTIFTGWLFSSIGLEFMNGFTELGIIVAVAVMGGFIIYFNEKKK